MKEWRDVGMKECKNSGKEEWRKEGVEGRMDGWRNGYKFLATLLSIIIYTG